MSRRTPGSLLLSLAALGIALLLAACADDDTASSSGDTDSLVEEKVWNEAALDDGAIAELTAECLDESGLPYELPPDGGVAIPHVPKSKLDAGKILDGCHERLLEAGLVPDPDKRRNPAEIDLQHAAWTKTVACLRKHDWPTFGPPSRKTFDEAFENPDALPSLYGPVLEQIGFGDLEHVLATCPYTY